MERAFYIILSFASTFLAVFSWEVVDFTIHSHRHAGAHLDRNEITTGVMG
jgi:hypothetical protein